VSILQQTVFRDQETVQVILGVAIIFFLPLVLLLINLLLSEEYYRAMDRHDREINAREAAARSERAAKP